MWDDKEGRMKFNDFPFIRYLFFFGFGVLLYPYISTALSSSSILFSLIFIWLVYLILIIINQSRKVYTFRFAFPFLAYSLLFMMGLWLALDHDPHHHHEHIVHHPASRAYLAKVQHNDLAKPNSFANTLSLLFALDSLGAPQRRGNIRIYHRSPAPLQPDQMVLITSPYERITSPQNPREFDYSAYMANEGIYHSQFVGDNIQVLGEGPPSIFGKMQDLRGRMLGTLSSWMKDRAAFEVASALLIGQKSSLSEEVGQAYASAGAMHVLAVSGLHVGIIYGFFLLFFKPAGMPVRARVLYLSIVILLIWAYALLTGMSASVMRAATMFTLMALAQMKSRTSSVFNALALSALILMVFKPNIIFAVGFQLSYAAMLGILILQPWIVKAWLPSNRIVYYFWEVTSVSIAAQLATLPLTLYYFNVYPTYSLFTNLLVIPGAFLIMAIGLPLLLLALTGLDLSLLARVLEVIVKALNEVIFFIHRLPGAQREGVFLSAGEAIALTLMIWGGYMLLSSNYKKTYAYLLATVMMVLVLSKASLWLSASTADELLVYRLSKGLAVDYKENEAHYYFHFGASLKDLEYKVLPNRRRSAPNEGGWLQGRSIGDSLVLALPSHGLLSSKGGLWKFNGLKPKEVYHYDGHQWQKMSGTEAPGPTTGAVKLIF